MKIKQSELGEGLRKLRDLKGLKEMAEGVGCSMAHISSIETGVRMPSINILNAYATATGKKIEVVFGA